MSVLIQGASLYLALNLGRLRLKVSPRALLIHSEDHPVTLVAQPGKA